jgi:hypothetical protein
MDICPGVVLLTGLFDYDEEYGAIGTGPRPTVTKKCLVSIRMKMVEWMDGIWNLPVQMEEKANLAMKRRMNGVEVIPDIDRLDSLPKPTLSLCLEVFLK